MLLIFPAVVSGQIDDDYPYIEQHSTALGFQMFYDHYNYDFTDDLSENYINYSTGIVFKRTFKTTLEFRTGLIYSEKGFIRTEPVYYGYPDFGFDVEYLIWAGYLDIPIQLGYRYPVNKVITLVPSGGFVFSFLVNKAVSSTVGDDVAYYEPLTDGLQNTLYGLNVALGIEIHAGKKWFFQLEPYFRNGFTTVHEDFTVSAPTSYGIGLGLFRKF